MYRIVDAIHPLGADDWQQWTELWKPVEYKRKQVLTQAGQREPYLYFVISGVQRVYYFDEEGREATLVFTYPPSFGGVLDSFLLQQPSRYAYETLTASQMLQAPFAPVLQLMDSRPAIGIMMRKALSHTMAGLLERIVELQCFSAEERFKKLLTRSPHILQLVPHKYLANYLGMDATNFSKLINGVRI